jgi:hypothetical protein
MLWAASTLVSSLITNTAWAGQCNIVLCSCGCGTMHPDIVVAVDTMWGAKAAERGSVTAGATGHVSALFALKAVGNMAGLVTSKPAEDVWCATCIILVVEGRQGVYGIGSWHSDYLISCRYCDDLSHGTFFIFSS